jgi:hypothetical protein
MQDLQTQLKKEKEKERKMEYKKKLRPTCLSFQEGFCEFLCKDRDQALPRAWWISHLYNISL